MTRMKSLGLLTVMVLLTITFLTTSPTLGCMTYTDVTEGMEVQVQLSKSGGYVQRALKSAFEEKMRQYKLRELQITKIKWMDVYITPDDIRIVTPIINKIDSMEIFEYKEKFDKNFRIDPKGVDSLTTKESRIPLKKFFIRALLARTSRESINLGAKVEQLLVSEEALHTPKKEKTEK